MRDNWSIELIVFIAWIVVLLGVIVPWMIRHPHHHGPATGESRRSWR